MLYNLEEVLGLSDEDIVEREQAKIKHSSIALNIARRAAQRAKERWEKDGERNSAYLHQIASFKYINLIALTALKLVMLYVLIKL